MADTNSAHQSPSEKYNLVAVYEKCRPVLFYGFYAKIITDFVLVKEDEKIIHRQFRTCHDMRRSIWKYTLFNEICKVFFDTKKWSAATLLIQTS